MESSIVDWYKNETVFLTGGSGYIGKGIIFKLLQCGVGRIYMLIRAKRGQDPKERVDLVAKHWIYDELREKGLDVRSKLFAIAGDVTIPNLGISEKDRLVLQQEVTVVLHTAASIKFDDPLKMAVFYNLRSARDLIDLAKGMKKLKILNHVSTAFCNIDDMANGNAITEKIYPAKMDWKKLIEFVETNPDELIAAVETKIMEGHVNSYLFTKHLAEKVIEDAAKYIPVTITRPPIVMGSLKEPAPGWLDNITSAVAIMAGVGKGVLRANTGHADIAKAYVPLDVTVNMILVSTWNQALVKKGHADGTVKIFNEEYQLFSDEDIHQYGIILFEKIPVHNAIWQMVYYSTTSLNVFLFYHIILHLLPGLFFDALLKITGNQPRLTKLYRKLYVAIVNLYPIVMINDKFDCQNYESLKKEVPVNEREIFQLNVPHDAEGMLKWTSDSLIGMRRFLGDPPEPTPEDFVHHRRLYWLHIAFQGLMSLLFLWLFPLHLLAAPFLFFYENIMSFFDDI